MYFSLINDTHKLYVFFDTVPKMYSVIDGEEKRFKMDIEKGQVLTDVNMHFNGKRIGVLIGVEKGEAVQFYLNDLDFLINDIPESVEVVSSHLLKSVNGFNVKQIGGNTFMLIKGK